MLAQPLSQLPSLVVLARAAAVLAHTRSDDDPFELFVSSTQISYTYYRDTYRVLGRTFGMLVLQDFEVSLSVWLILRTFAFADVRWAGTDTEHSCAHG